MAHGDALIFLTNITWVFILFIVLYLFFVVYFLPTFYKKFRIRTLIKSRLNFVSLAAVQNAIVSVVYFIDFFKELCLRSVSFISLKLKRFAHHLSAFKAHFVAVSGGRVTNFTLAQYFFNDSSAVNSIMFFKFVNKK